jgi:hypothetical protein
VQLSTPVGSASGGRSITEAEWMCTMDITGHGFRGELEIEVEVQVRGGGGLMVAGGEQRGEGSLPLLPSHNLALLQHIPTTGQGYGRMCLPLQAKVYAMTDHSAKHGGLGLLTFVLVGRAGCAWAAPLTCGVRDCVA